MEKEELLESDSALIVDEPHFEEEWTILTARPVVPLDEVESKNGVHHAVKLVLAFVGASLLGVFVALASVRFRGVMEPPSAAAIRAQNDTPKIESANTAPTEERAVVPEPTETRGAKTPVSATERSKRPSGPDSSLAEDRAAAADSSTAQPRLVDEWQERRPRRTMIRRQRRDNDDLHHRDLMRIQEIFEGRRPRN
jgi:hypothetical protein